MDEEYVETKRALVKMLFALSQAGSLEGYLFASWLVME
jgi:hypothetical protein